ncbi:MAG: recombination protein RecR [Chitinispirillaceae bacterium]|nr:recombination protein RecR [Chitinispirillaceae bacterium]
MIKVLDDLIDRLCTLPTIGKKSATRLALHLVERPLAEVEALARAIVDARQRIVLCGRCFTYSETGLCPICASATRDQSLVCVVEKPPDVFAIEKIGRFRGVYHVLGGVLSPLAGVTPDKLRIAELAARIEQEKPSELIIGLGGSAEAETTALYLVRRFHDAGVRITRLARGMPAGMEIEYVDQITLGQALNERTDIHYGE